MGVTGLKAAVASVYVLMFIMNTLANTLPFFGRTTGAVSDAFPNLLTPLGYAFSIWALIYVLLGIMVARTLTLPQEMVSDASMRIFLYAFISSSLLNAGWLFSWHALRPGLALLVMLGLLASLIIAWLHAPDDRLLRLPFSVYLGWISVATLLNITIVLSVFGLKDAVNTDAYVIVALLLGTIAAMTVLSLRGDVPYALVFVWAYTAIFLRHLSEENTVLYSSAGFLSIFILFMGILAFLQNGYALYGE